MSDARPEEDRRPTRRERERERHRQEILDAARRVVTTRGLDGVTVEEVAREAEFAVGSIYRHFRSKDELVQELLVALSARYLDELGAAIDAPGPFDEVLEHVVQLAHDRHVALQPILQAFFAAPGPIPRAGTPSGDALGGLRARYQASFRRLVARGQADGRLRHGDPAPVALALTGLVTTFARATAAGEHAGDAAADVLALFLRGAGRADRI